MPDAVVTVEPVEATTQLKRFRDVPFLLHRHPTPVVGRGRAPHAGGFADDDLVLEGIAAVPDVSATLAGASLRSAWRVARRARTEGFDTAVCVRWDDDAELPVLVARMRRAAGAAGYRTLLAPWAPPGQEPETTHQIFTRTW